MSDLPSTKVILIVDDEPGVRQSLRRLLTHAGYDVLEAASGIEAVEQVRLSAVDGVLLDLVMPDQDGLETLHILLKERPGLKVIAITGRFPDLLRTAELMGAIGSLVKPIEAEELLDVLKRKLGESSA